MHAVQYQINAGHLQASSHSPLLSSMRLSVSPHLQCPAAEERRVVCRLFAGLRSGSCMPHASHIHYSLLCYAAAFVHFSFAVLLHTGFVMRSMPFPLVSLTSLIQLHAHNCDCHVPAHESPSSMRTLPLQGTPCSSTVLQKAQFLTTSSPCILPTLRMCLW